MCDHKNQWEFQEIQDIKEDWQEEECLYIKKKELSKKQDQSPIPKSSMIKPESEESESEEETTNSEPSESNRAISIGLHKQLPEKPEFWMSSIMHPITN